jgi:hypothetical protein
MLVTFIFEYCNYESEQVGNITLLRVVRVRLDHIFFLIVVFKAFEFRI